MIKIVQKILSFSFILVFLILNPVFAQNCCQPCPMQCECECCACIEHLCTHKNSPVNLVRICGCNAIIERHTVIEANFMQKINSKKLCPGDNISFVLKNGLCTQEGRRILPNCSHIIACVECIIPPKALNKNAQVSLNFRYVLLPDGRAFPVQARILSSTGMLKETKWMSAGKVALWTVGLFGVGTGLAAAIGSGTRHAGQAALTIGMPVGFGVGLLGGLVTPGLHYRAKCDEKVLIQFTDNFQVALN